MQIKSMAALLSCMQRGIAALKKENRIFPEEKTRLPEEKAATYISKPPHTKVTKAKQPNEKESKKPVLTKKNFKETRRHHEEVHSEIKRIENRVEWPFGQVGGSRKGSLPSEN